MPSKSRSKRFDKSAEFVLGMDGGGSKTICAIADADGNVVGVGHACSTNFQAVGRYSAAEEAGKAIDAAVKAAGISHDQIVSAAYGVAGADREADFDTVVELISPVNPAGMWLLCNDTTIALRAGTNDGIGLALICGSGSNCIGFNSEGKVHKVGGYGHFSGDVGYGEDLVTRALVEVTRYLDGRGPKTMMNEAFCKALGVEHVEDIIERWFPYTYNPIELKRFAPVVFDCAKKGDRVAIRLLEKLGDQLAYNAVTALKNLFPDRKEKVTVVLGGSILQHSDPPIYAERIKAAVLKLYPNADIVRLKQEPVTGAVLFALDLMHGKAGKTRTASVHRSYAQARQIGTRNI